MAATRFQNVKESCPRHLEGANLFPKVSRLFTRPKKVDVDYCQVSSGFSLLVMFLPNNKLEIFLPNGLHAQTYPNLSKS